MSVSYTHLPIASAVLSNDFILPFPDEETISRQVALARQVADVVIVSMHWGEENITQPTAQMQNWAKVLAAQNVDVVLGMHSHTLMPIEWLDAVSYTHLDVYKRQAHLYFVTKAQPKDVLKHRHQT